MTARDELVNALARRYAVAGRAEKTRILDEFVAIAGFQPKARDAAAAVRTPAARRSEGKASRRIYDEAVREAIVVLWEASDRICGKRLKALMPVLVEAMERHGHLRLGAEIRAAVLAMSASDDRPVASRGPRAGERQEAPSGGCAIVDPQEHSGAHVLGLGRPAAGVRRGRPRRALRPGGERELRANAYGHRHRHGMDRVRTASVPRTDPAQGGAGRGPQAAAVRTARFRHGQRQRFRERDGARLLPGFRDCFHPLPSVAQERPGLCRAEEWRDRPPHRRLPPPRGSGRCRGAIPALHNDEDCS